MFHLLKSQAIPTRSNFFLPALIRGFAALKKNYYDILGVAQSASQEDIKKAYKALALKWHPDRNQDKKKATAELKFRQIAEAYSTLSNPTQRHQYDASLHGRQSYDVSMNPTAASMSFEDAESLFEEIFRAFYPFAHPSAASAGPGSFGGQKVYQTEVISRNGRLVERRITKIRSRTGEIHHLIEEADLGPVQSSPRKQEKPIRRNDTENIKDQARSRTAKSSTPFTNTKSAYSPAISNNSITFKETVKEAIDQFKGSPLSHELKILGRFIITSILVQLYHRAMYYLIGPRRYQ